MKRNSFSARGMLSKKGLNTIRGAFRLLVISTSLRNISPEECRCSRASGMLTPREGKTTGGASAHLTHFDETGDLNRVY